MGTQSENQFRAEARDANNEVKGGVISECIINSGLIFTEMYQIPSLNFLLQVEKFRTIIWFGFLRMGPNGPQNPQN